MNTTDKKTATGILAEYSINIMQLNDDFNTQLLHAMQVYADQEVAAALSSGGRWVKGTNGLKEGQRLFCRLELNHSLRMVCQFRSGYFYEDGSTDKLLNQRIEWLDESASQVIEDSENDYWKKRCEAAESLISVMDRPRNLAPYEDNEQFLLYRERNAAWEKSMHLSPKPIESNK